MAQKKVSLRKTSKRRVPRRGARAKPKTSVVFAEAPWLHLFTGMDCFPISEARKFFAEATDAAVKGKRIGFERYGRLKGVLVSVEDAVLLVLLDDPRFVKLKERLERELKKY